MDSLNVLAHDLKQIELAFENLNNQICPPVIRRKGRPCTRKQPAIRRERTGSNTQYWREYRALNRDANQVQVHNCRASKRGVPGQVTEQQWQEVKSKWEGRCAYCGTTAFPLQMDHVVPLSRYAKGDTRAVHQAENLRPACGPCNRAKSDMPLEVFLAWLDGRLKTEKELKIVKEKCTDEHSF